MGGWAVVIAVLAVLLVAGAFVFRLVRSRSDDNNSAETGYFVMTDRPSRDRRDRDDDDIDSGDSDGDGNGGGD